MRLQNQFKGEDHNQQTQARKQLDEYPDVIAHRDLTNEHWDDEEIYIQAKTLRKVYGDGVAAVNDNTFQVKRGEVFGLLGPNGAGKSTMFNVMTMDLKRTSGQVKILGKDLDQLSVQNDGNRLGMCP